MTKKTPAKIGVVTVGDVWHMHNIMCDVRIILCIISSSLTHAPTAGHIVGVMHVHCYSADTTIKALTSKVNATVGEGTLPFVPPVPDACEGQGLKCPLAPNVPVKFKTGLKIPKIPLTNVSVYVI